MKPKINNTAIKTKTPAINAKPSSTANQPGKLSSPKSTKESVTNPNQGNGGGNPPNNNSGQGNLGSSGNTGFKAETQLNPYEKNIVMNDVKPYKVGPVINPSNISSSTSTVLKLIGFTQATAIVAKQVLDYGEDDNSYQTNTSTSEASSDNSTNTGSTTSSSENYTAPRINGGESVESPDN
jgi:hypothetical protein